MKVLADAFIVSELAAALEALPDERLASPAFRFASYRPTGLLAAGDDFQRLDLMACRAEMIRRALRVGRGFSAKREAA